MTCVLDASALLALIQDEKGGEKIKTILEKKPKPFIHAINILEVEYKLKRKHPKLSAEKSIRWLKKAPLTIAEVLTPQITNYSLYLKSKYHLSLGDSIGLGLANFLGYSFLTADRHELAPIAKAENIKIEFIR